MPAGGGALAEKLVETYFTLFKLILEGKLGHAGQLAAAKEEKASLPGKKGAKAIGKGAQSKKGSKSSLPAGKAHRPPSSIEQVHRCGPFFWPTQHPPVCTSISYAAALCYHHLLQSFWYLQSAEPYFTQVNAAATTNVASSWQLR